MIHTKVINLRISWNYQNRQDQKQSNMIAAEAMITSLWTKFNKED